MEELLDQIADFVSDLPVGLIIFLIAIAFSFFGRGENEQRQAPERRVDAQEAETSDPFAREETPRPVHTFASDERREREERARQQEREEVLVFGGMDFGSRDALFRDENEESQWGKTKFGFDESEWGSAFGEKKNSDPIIR